eukprot:TRINITY_DN878_c0_g1_i1.p1 TRINITY_DN878_c0_g1~~TRINITY_DN878_c0_g1_i1.p1  ORF type:complete len:232 (-),score=73.47 TRINITY_DN878_c0_g1_i1:20-667(-)
MNELSARLAAKKQQLDAQAPADPRDSKEKPSEIIQNFLYLGNEFNASNKSQLDDIGIKYIVNMADDVKNFFVSEDSNFVYLNPSIPDDETASLFPSLESIFSFLDAAESRQEKVLVHCRLGISRSASVVLAAVMRSKNITFADAYNLVKAKRSIVKPNPSFIAQLNQLDNIWFPDQQTEGKKQIKVEDVWPNATLKSWKYVEHQFDEKLLVSLKK